MDERKERSIGRELFLKQLEFMKGDGFEMELDCLSENNEKTCASLIEKNCHRTCTKQ